MKKSKLAVLIVLPVLFALNNCLAQQKGHSSIGLTYQPSYNWIYNKYDWRRVSPNKFNGWSGGIIASRSISDRFSLSTELNYSRQRQEFYISHASIQIDDSTSTKLYSKSASIRLDYLKLPILACFNLEVGYGSGLYLVISGGPQIAFSTSYNGKSIAYGSTKIAPIEIDYGVIDWTTTITPSHYHHDFQESDGTHSINDIETDYVYKRIELGVVGGIALQKRILESYAISIGARFEQGLTGIERTGDDNSYYAALGGDTGFYIGRPSTHTRRAALVLSFSKTFD